MAKTVKGKPTAIIAKTIDTIDNAISIIIIINRIGLSNKIINTSVYFVIYLM